MLTFFAAQTQLLADEPKPGAVAHHYLAAHFVTGYCAENAGAFRCPVLGDVTETKIAIYVKEASSRTLHFASALEKSVQRYPQLKRSFFLVSEENRGSFMTDVELTEKSTSLQAAGQKTA